MASPIIRKAEQCRVCGFKPLQEILSLGDLYVTNFVDANTVADSSPLDVVLCEKKAGGCGLLQLRHTFPQETMYETYWYRSGINDTMRNELASIVKAIQAIVPLKEGDYVIDIGSNDSTLLRNYASGVRTVGYEPAKNLMTYAEPGVTKVFNDFFNAAAWEKSLGGVKAKAITAIAMFYDLDDPNSFVADLATCLDDEGVCVIQQNYLPVMLERNVFDNISHEHLEYYSFLSFENLMKRHGFEIFDVELNDVNGGSMRTYMRREGKGKTIRIPEGAAARVTAIREKESGMKLDEKKPYDDFANRVKAIKDQLGAFIREEVAKGKKIYAYGASTRGNTLLQYCGIDHTLVVAAAERNPDKWGRKTVGTLIPIVSEDEARKANPDYFLVLPWQFLPEFIKREADFLKRGGKFIVPLPEFKIVSG